MQYKFRTPSNELIILDDKYIYRKIITVEDLKYFHLSIESALKFVLKLVNTDFLRNLEFVQHRSICH